MKGIKVPSGLVGINDRGDKVHVTITSPGEVEEMIVRVAGQDTLLPLAERHGLSGRAITLSSSEGMHQQVEGGAICVNPRANEWWIEGVESKQGGCFFLSAVEKITEEVVNG